MNWTSIRPLNGSQQGGFEELVCQLARRDKPSGGIRFTRKGTPDAGVECFWKMDDGSEVGWQAKYFTQSLGSSQWSQLDDSVKTALKSHPSLTKYVIALPIDPPDARRPGQASLLQKWEGRVERWRGWAAERGMTVQFKAWWSSDLINRLQRPENAGLTYFWFNEAEFTDTKLANHNADAIADLGPRYTPEHHVTLHIEDVFDGLERNESFQKRVRHHFDQLLRTGERVVTNASVFRQQRDELNDLLEGLRTFYDQTNFTGNEPIQLSDLEDQLENCSRSVSEIRELEKPEWQAVEVPEDDRNRKTYLTPAYREFINALHEAQDFFGSRSVTLAQKPYLLVTGDAGSGKSHLLGDLVRRRTEEKLPTLLFLGQKLGQQPNPLNQLLGNAGMTCSPDEFLGALNAKAEACGYRAFIVIDALNEGGGMSLWPNSIRGFVQNIARYDWIGLVLSVRSSYERAIAPAGDTGLADLTRVHHIGFAGREFDAVKVFFENNGLELPSVPMLDPEFSNPLFLKLFCEGLRKRKLTRVPSGLQGFTVVIDHFIDATNWKLALERGYPPSINIVRKAVYALIEAKLSASTAHIPYEEAFSLLQNVANTYNVSDYLLETLISEGVLTKNLFWSENSFEEGVYLAYERFEDHLTVKYLLAEAISPEDLFSDGGALARLNSPDVSWADQGLINALSIQLPETYGKELHEVAPNAAPALIAEGLIRSLAWRRTDTISPDLKDKVLSVVEDSPNFNGLFLNTLFTVASLPEHPFNANFLHDRLFEMSLAHRDWVWTLPTYDLTEPLDNRLIAWARNGADKSEISNDALLLASIALAWLLTSSNRFLRDAATKALINLLQNRLDILMLLIERFHNVNDPYVYERLFAVAYGCALRTSQTDKLANLATFCFETVFDTDGEVYPHILLRDYARGIIEYAVHLGELSSLNIDRVRPPYRSEMPDAFPTRQEIKDRYELDNNAETFRDYLWAQNTVLYSMRTDYGEDKGGYGDFGRYTFQNALRDWEVEPDKLAHLAIEWVFGKYEYDVEKFGHFDRRLRIGGRGNRSNGESEAIGKKYQWLALHEMLARVADNCSRKDGVWRPGPYGGPWEPFVRDIDPSVVVRMEDWKAEGDEAEADRWWSPSGVITSDLRGFDWLRDPAESDVPDIKSYLKVMDPDGAEWLMLEGYPKWREPLGLGEDENREGRLKHQVWNNVMSCLVRKDDLDSVLVWVGEQDLAGRWLPERPSAYQIFSREYYWAPSVSETLEGYDGRFQLVGRDSNNLISEAWFTTLEHMWGGNAERDRSPERDFHTIRPSKILLEGMKLRHGPLEYEYLDGENEVVLTEPSLRFGGETFLLVRKDALEAFLEHKNLAIIWIVLGEKLLISGFPSSGGPPPWTTISGVFTLEAGRVQGEQRFELPESV